MDQNDIKTGQEVVDEFVKSIGQEKKVDKETLESIKDLHLNNKLTKTNLLEILRKKREEKQCLD